MNRNERRSKRRECLKELEFIINHTPYKEFQTSTEFNDLSPNDIDILAKGEWEDKTFQARFDLAKKIFMRVDYLTQMIELLTKPAERPVPQEAQTPDPHI